MLTRIAVDSLTARSYADVEALHAALTKKGVAISEPLTMQWWGDRTFKVLDPNGYEIWFYTNVAEPRPPVGAKLF